MWPLFRWDTCLLFLACQVFLSWKDVKECWILSRAFSPLIEMIMWVFSFILLMWHIILIQLHMLSHNCIPRTNLTWSWCIILFNSVQSLSCVRLFVIPWTATCQAFLSFPISQSLLKVMSIESVMLSNCLIFCRPLSLLPWMFPGIKIFSNELALPIRWPKIQSISFSISPSVTG